jgi:phosphohistidine phosphatase SixA
VRHGHAGRRADWHRADTLRPLSARGVRQSEQLVKIVTPLSPTRVISSPYLRCLQTAEPIGASAGLKVEQSSTLVPDAPAEALRLLRRLTAAKSKSGVVVVTHGEVIGDVLRRIAKDDGVKLDHRPPGLKGCAWILRFRNGKLVAAQYVAPS